MRIPEPIFRVGNRVRTCYQSPIELGDSHCIIRYGMPIVAMAFQLSPGEHPDDLDSAVKYGYWVYKLNGMEARFFYREEELVLIK